MIPDTITTENGDELKVTRILKNAFKDQGKLKSVTFGKYIEVVEQSAFQGCTSLKKLTVSNVLRVLGDKAFYRCRNLETVKLPMTIERLGDACFKYCKKLKEAYIGVRPAWMTAADIGTEEYLEAEATINITIGAGVFANCTNLSKVIINCQVRIIGNSAFSNCTRLTAIEVYSKILQTVGNKALKGVHDCRISVLKVKIKKYKKLFKNKGQGKKVVVAKL